MDHLTPGQLTAGLDSVRRSPTGEGRVVLIVRRPERDSREVVDEARLDPDEGLVGDSWFSRTGGKPSDIQRQAQLTLMNARFAALVAGSDERRQLAGDQLFVDLDLSHAQLPAGSSLQLGDAIVEISAIPHTGCSKFAARFGQDALDLVNSEVGRELRLRGVNCRVVRGGTVRVGDVVRCQPAAVANVAGVPAT